MKGRKEQPSHAKDCSRQNRWPKGTISSQRREPSDSESVTSIEEDADMIAALPMPARKSFDTFADGSAGGL